MAGGGLILSTVGGLVMHLLPGKILVVLAACAQVVCCLLFAIMPPAPVNYWAYVFPAMVCATLGVDITFSVTNVFITTSMPRHRQGLAGALIYTTLFLAIGFFLGIADLAVTSTEDLGLRGSYKVAFWFGVACSATSCVAFVLVKMGRAKSDLTHEERMALEAELMADRERGEK